MKFAYPIVILLTIAAVVTAISLIVNQNPNDYHHKPARDRTDLAQRINQACKPGSLLSDWTTGDEYNPVPKGTVKVTCITKQGTGTIYYVAVAR